MSHTSTAEPIVVGDTATFKLTASKDGSAWDLTGGTVQLYLRKSDGTVTGPLAATIVDGPSGVAQYTTDESQIDSDGRWQRQWKVSAGGVTLSSRPIPFDVDRFIG